MASEDYAAEVAAARRERPSTRFSEYDYGIVGDRAWFRFTLKWTGLNTEHRWDASPGRHAGSKAATSRRLGSWSNSWARHGPARLRRNAGRASARNQESDRSILE